MHKTHELRLAKRMARLGTETAFEVLVKAKALEAKGRDIIHLEIGEPDFDTPGNIIDAGCDALRKGFTHYGPSSGLVELRQAIAQYVSETRRVTVTPDEVVVVPGGKPIIFFSILALAEDGDEIIYPNPGFPIYESMINYVGAKAVPIRLREELNFRLDVDELAGLITDRTKLVIVNSPHNPTGGVLEKKDLEAIARAIGDRNIMVLSDEIYSQLIFQGEHHSIMSLDGMKERTILLDGFSKTYAMTGWRMGYGVMRVDLATHISRLMTNSNSCTASFTQVAGIEALRGSQKSVDAMRAEFKKRRDIMVAGLNKITGFSCQMPHGAFYVFPNITQTGWPSKKLADALLDDAGVAALSGTAFGEFGEGYLRFSVANSIENIEKALDRIDGWTKKNL
ncbi:MAG TPA: pyridoxal phosphate-dependent aminotransferase [Candidatus Udaeobacter sp.]|jgi:aspartate/methionine/tyrosine aminotransferase